MHVEALRDDKRIVLLLSFGAYLDFLRMKAMQKDSNVVLLLFLEARMLYFRLEAMQNDQHIDLLSCGQLRESERTLFLSS